MKKRNILSVAVMTLLIFTASCKQDDEISSENQGVLKLSVGISDKIDVVSRASENDESDGFASLEESCKIRIYGNDVLVRKYEGISSIPEEIPLMCGNYKVRVTAGDSVEASFDKKFYETIKDFEINKDVENSVNVDCYIKNTAVKIKWDESISEIFKDYKVTVSLASGTSLEFPKDQVDKTGYFMVPADSKKLKFKFEGTTIAGEEKFQSELERTVEYSTLYNVNYKFVEEPSKGGAASIIAIDVDTDFIGESNSTVSIKQRPKVVCKDDDNVEYPMETPLYLSTNLIDKSYYLWVSTSSSIKSLLIVNDKFKELGFNVTNIDIVNLSNQDLEILKNWGIEVIKKTPAINDEGINWALKFTSSLISKMTAEENVFKTKFHVEDVNGKVTDVDWDIVVSSATVALDEIIPYEVWTNKAVLRGRILQEPSGEVKFRYRKKGVSDWTVISSTVIEQNVYAEISGLLSNTTYEYQILDGETASVEKYEFITEAEFQPENPGFEFTSGSCPLLLYGDGQSMWWDSGNTGSYKMNKNVTTVDNTLKHSGTQSLLLSSQFVGLGIIGKFAAGNVFVGKYLGTDGTDGILGWGRPCSSRPKALKLWVRYTPGTVDYESSGRISKGDTDKGNIYIAVGDWSGMTESSETWPFVVKTKNASSLFSKEKGTYSGDGIIGYGEKIFEETYEDNGNLKELTIPLDYDNYGGNNRKPTSIIIVASASYYGDYFAGSSSSRMWIDDVELIYE